MSRRTIRVAALAALVPAVLGTTLSSLRGTAAAAGATRPNLVVIMVDDLTERQYLDHMPQTRARLEPGGIRFTDSVVSFPECCPSRATYLTGQYSHNHGVDSGTPPSGGYTRLDHTETLPVWLDAAGYRTAHVGKYLNGYGYDAPPDIPPGWDDWFSLIDPSTQFVRDYLVNDNGSIVHFGTAPEDYREEVLTARALEVIDDAASDPDPFFLSFNPPAPHAGWPDSSQYDGGRLESASILPEPPIGYHPPASTAGSLSGLAVPRGPDFNEADVSDKPAFRQTLELLDGPTVDTLAELYRSSSEMVVALDGYVASIVDRLEATGELADTVVVLTSDNGVYYGEHRLAGGKFHPFEPALRVPLVVRGPGFPGGTTDGRPVANVDLAPTLLAAAGATPGRAMDGIALQELVADPALLTERPVLIETGQLWGRRFYHGVRTTRYKYLEHVTGERELYDLGADPYELENLADQPGLTEVQAQLRTTLLGLRACAGTACLDPPPPTGTAPPVAHAGHPNQVAPGQTAYLVASASFDPDGGPITYQWTALDGTPPGILNANGAVGIARAPSTPQTLRYRVTVTDQTGLSASAETTVAVGYPFGSPIVDAGADRTVRSGSIVYLVAEGSSPTFDPSQLGYRWVLSAGPPVGILNTDRRIAVLRAPPGPATLTFGVVVTDPDFRTGNDLVRIRVNGAPRADAGPDRSFATSSVVFANGSASSDPDGDALTYRWTQVAGPATGIVGQANPGMAAKAPASPASLTYRITVTDVWGDASTDDVTVTVIGAG